MNAGNGQVYKINRSTGESSLLIGSKEYPVTVIPPPLLSPEDIAKTALNDAIRQAKESEVLEKSLPKESYPYRSNGFFITEILETDHEAKIKGWRGQKIDEGTYLVSFTYEDVDGQERGFYFEVTYDITGNYIVRNIFHGTGLYSRYAKYGINPVYELGSDGKPRSRPVKWIQWDDESALDPSQSKISK